MTEKLSGIELRKAVAEVMGWTKMSYRYRDLWAFPPIGDLIKKGVPEYEHDLNAVFRDMVSFAKASGYRLDLRDYGPMWNVQFWSKSGTPVGTTQHENLATAICWAFVKLRGDKDVQEGQKP